jgi:anti-sigma regulatory factor (Ser/Thr protein kinase)
LDFSECTEAYPNSLLPILANVQVLIQRGAKTQCILPKNESTRKLFLNANYAYFLSPDEYSLSDTARYRHLACRRFLSDKEQRAAVNDTIDVVMRTLELSRDMIGGLEWTLNEITDNVLNHAQSPVGGFVQLTTYLRAKRIEFCVADVGRGVLSTLREAFPNLRTDRNAIDEAVRAGITRNKDIGQGNGLSGTLKIAIAAKGSLSITSGVDTTVWTPGGVQHLPSSPYSQAYTGTLVDVQTSTASPFDLTQVLSGWGSPESVTPTGPVELRYASHTSNVLPIIMVREESGFGSRRAGSQMRIKCKNLLQAMPDHTLVIDWDGIQMISSSFADEFVGKLFVDLGPITFMSKVKQTNAMPVVQSLLDRAILQRTQQEMQATQDSAPNSQ